LGIVLAVAWLAGALAFWGKQLRASVKQE